MNTLEKVNLNSQNITQETINELKRIIPSAFKEGKIDFDALKTVLGDIVEPNREFYNFTWAGKSEAFKHIQQPSIATLKPCKEESINFDNTENIFIEGDNLEVLKLLQKTYYSKVKMIYIDPPYNKDKDFVYPDRWSEGIKSYKEYCKFINEGGDITTTDNEASATVGRKHSHWLTMMYPRLFLARNLLIDDGVIVIHIDESEYENLFMICKEIFGEENHLGTIIWDKGNPKGDTKTIAMQHEYIVSFSKNIEVFKEKNSLKREKKNAKKILNKANQLYKKLNKEIVPKDLKNCIKNYSLDIDGNNYKSIYTIEDINIEFQEWINKQDFSNGEKAYKYIDEQGKVYQSVSMAWPNKKQAPANYFIPLIHPITKRECPLPEKGWRNPPTGMKELLDNDMILFGEDENIQPRRKYILEDNMYENIPSILFFGGSDDRLFKKIKLSFDNPKPYNFSKELISYFLRKDDIVLDFFAGSGTTAHATMALNIEKNSSIKYISVQLPEHLDKKNQKKSIEFLKSINRPTNIAEITKERIRRVGKLLKEETPNINMDIGFKVFKLDESNFKQWDSAIQDVKAFKQAIIDFSDNVIKGSEKIDMLYELLLKKGYDLNSKIEKQQINKNEIFIVNNKMYICLDNQISKETIEEIIKLRPKNFIVLDKAFNGDDELKTNTFQTFKTLYKSSVNPFETV